MRGNHDHRHDVRLGLGRHQCLDGLYPEPRRPTYRVHIAGDGPAAGLHDALTVRAWSVGEAIDQVIAETGASEVDGAHWTILAERLGPAEVDLQHDDRGTMDSMSESPYRITKDDSTGQWEIAGTREWFRQLRASIDRVVDGLPGDEEAGVSVTALPDGPQAER